MQIFNNASEFDDFRKKIAEKLSEQNSNILMNGLHDLICDSYPAPIKYNGQYFALFYDKSWRSKNYLYPSLKPKKDIRWGEMDLTQAVPTQSNYFLHIELEYNINQNRLVLRLHLETNRYVSNSRLNEWVHNHTDRQAWFNAFNTMRDNCRIFLKDKNIGGTWEKTNDARVIMQLARTEYMYDDNKEAMINFFVNEIKIAYDFLVKIKIHEKLEFWPSK